MKNLIRILIWLSMCTINKGAPWCPCRNKSPNNSKSGSFTIQNKLDYNPTRPPQNYVNSDQFRWTRNNARQDNPNIEIFPNDLKGRNPLKFHVEADYEEPAVINEEYFTNNHQQNKLKTQFRPTTKWRPRLKPPERFPKTRLELRNQNFKGKQKMKGSQQFKKSLLHWPFPLKLIDSILPYPPTGLQRPKKRYRLKKHRFKPPPPHHYKPEMENINHNGDMMNNYKQNEQIYNEKPENYNPQLQMMDNENGDEDEEEVDFPPDVMQAFFDNNNFNHNTQWPEDSDPEQGFKNVRVVMPETFHNNDNDDNSRHFEAQRKQNLNFENRKSTKCGICRQNTNY